RLRHLVLLGGRLLDLLRDSLLAQRLDARGERHARRIDLRLRGRCLRAQCTRGEGAAEETIAAVAGTSGQRNTAERQRLRRGADKGSHEQHPRIAFVAVERTPRAYISLLLPTLILQIQHPQALARAFPPP